jgi:tetratricopeptide (TPR) repeat protein
MSKTYVVDRPAAPGVYRRVTRLGSLLLCVAIAACGGGSKKAATTAGAGGGKTSGTDAASMNDNGGTPDGSGVPNSAGGGDAGGGGGGATGGAGGGGGGATPSNTADPVAETPVTFPNYDPDPAAAKSQVDQQLAIAKSALAQSPPDADAALRAAREALKIDAASVDAAAFVAFAYYHKKQYDTAELVLDDLFKRPSAKKNANVFYVYGLVYDKTNRFEVAVKAYAQAVELNPSFASAHVNLGAHQLRNKQYGAAQGTFEKLTRELNRNDAVTLTSLGSAYRGRSGDYPAGSNDRNSLIMSSEASYKKALASNANYGAAYFNLALLYLDSDPFPSGGGALDTLQRLNAAKAFLDQYKNAPGVDIRLYDERMKDVTKAITREEKRRKKAAKQK